MSISMCETRTKEKMVRLYVREVSKYVLTD